MINSLTSLTATLTIIHSHKQLENPVNFFIAHFQPLQTMVEEYNLGISYKYLQPE